MMTVYDILLEQAFNSSIPYEKRINYRVLLRSVKNA